MDFEAINAAALPQAERLLAEWLPDGRREGNEWVARNPRRNDHQPGSFKVNLQTGKWADFATNDQGGDLVSLYAYLQGLSQSEAARRLAEELGLDNGDGRRSSATRPDRSAWKVIQPVPEGASEPPAAHYKHGKPSQIWAYRDQTGRLLGHVYRFDRPGGGKEVLPLIFCQGPDGRREWRWQAFPEPRPLYGLDCLAARPDAPVLVVEGEKTADAALRLFPEWVAITSPGGSKAASMADWTVLKGRRVVISPDLDEAGEKYGCDVARLARQAGAVEIKRLTWPHQGEPKKGWDLADALAEGWTPALVEQALDKGLARLEPWPEEQLALQSSDSAVERTLAPLKALPKNPSSAKLDQALRKFGQACQGLDQISQAVAREGAIEALQVLGLGSPARLVDAALPKLGADKASAGQGQPPVLPDPEPWPDPVDGAALLDELAGVICRYVALPDHAASTVALWAVFTHAHDCFPASPILALQSPEKRCGKTTLLSLLNRMVAKPLANSNITPAALFRTIEAHRPTLLIDEADSFWKKNDELRGILNSGHTRGAAFVVRVCGEEMEPRRFSTWAPKALALIGRLPATLEDRSIVIPMRRRKPDEKVEPLRLNRRADDRLARLAARWVKDNAEGLRQADDPVMPLEITNDRARDNWAPLLAIADLAGGGWPERARRAMVALEAGRGEDAESSRTLLLADIRALFEARKSDRLTTTEIIEHLTGLEERPWGDFDRGRPMTPRTLAKMLKPFGIKPQVLRMGDQTTRGYRLTDFRDAFSRYLPPLDPQQRNNPDFTWVSGQSRSVTPTPDVTDDIAYKSPSSRFCYVVADKIGEPQAEGEGKELACAAPTRPKGGDLVSALAQLLALGLEVSLGPRAGTLRLAGLDRISQQEAEEAISLACQHKAEILELLQAQDSPPTAQSHPQEVFSLAQAAFGLQAKLVLTCAAAIPEWSGVESPDLASQPLAERIRQEIRRGEGAYDWWQGFYQRLTEAYFEATGETSVPALWFARLAAARGLAVETHCLPWISGEVEMIQVRAEWERFKSKQRPT